jgi:hypothetical protein
MYESGQRRPLPITARAVPRHSAIHLAPSAPFLFALRCYGGETASDGMLVVSFEPDSPVSLSAQTADTPASNAPSSRRGQGDR